MNTLWDIASGAPWWAYLLFVYFVIIGIKATKPREIPISVVFILPLVFVIWSFSQLYTKLEMGMSSLLYWWLASLVAGTFLGVLEVHKWHIQKDKRKGRITIPGNYSTLILILIIFILKFFWGYIYAIDPHPSYAIYLFDTISSALVCGFFIGRAAFFFKSYHF